MLCNLYLFKKGTQMLKEILKIDGSDTTDAKTATNEVLRQDSCGPALQHRHTKKMGMYRSLSVTGDIGTCVYTF